MKSKMDKYNQDIYHRKKEPLYHVPKPPTMEYSVGIYRGTEQLYLHAIPKDDMGHGLTRNSGLELAAKMEPVKDLEVIIYQHKDGSPKILFRLYPTQVCETENSVHQKMEQTFYADGTYFPCSDSSVHGWIRLIRREIVVLERDAHLGFGIVAGVNCTRSK